MTMEGRIMKDAAKQAASFMALAWCAANDGVKHLLFRRMVSRLRRTRRSHHRLIDNASALAVAAALQNRQQRVLCCRAAQQP